MDKPARPALKESLDTIANVAAIIAIMLPNFITYTNIKYLFI